MATEIRLIADTRSNSNPGLVVAEVWFDEVFGWQIICEGLADEDVAARLQSRIPEFEAQRQGESDGAEAAALRMSARTKIDDYVSKADAKTIEAIGLTAQEAEVAKADAAASAAIAATADAP